VTPGATTPPRATPPANPAFNAETSASAIIDSARIINQIQTATLAQRDTVTSELGSRMDAAQRALATLRERMSLPGQRSGNTFVWQRAFMQARACDQAMRKSLQAARESGTASTWSTAQAALVRNYGDYAKAVADVEAAARSPVAVSP
jgi:hypothetical protein